MFALHYDVAVVVRARAVVVTCMKEGNFMRRARSKYEWENGEKERPLNRKKMGPFPSAFLSPCQVVGSHVQFKGGSQEKKEREEEDHKSGFPLGPYDDGTAIQRP